jgi:hypothetical protein
MWNVFEATVHDGRWEVVDSTANVDDPNVSQAGQGVDVANATMALSRLGSVGGDSYLSTRLLVSRHARARRQLRRRRADGAAHPIQ